MVVVCPVAVRAAFGFVATDPPPTGVNGAAAVPGVIATPPAQESAGSGTLALMAACSAASVAAYMASKEGPDQVDAGGVPALSRLFVRSPSSFLPLEIRQPECPKTMKRSPANRGSTRLLRSPL